MFVLILQSMNDESTFFLSRNEIFEIDRGSSWNFKDSPIFRLLVESLKKFSNFSNDFRRRARNVLENFRDFSIFQLPVVGTGFHQFSNNSASHSFEGFFPFFLTTSSLARRSWLKRK